MSTATVAVCLHQDDAHQTIGPMLQALPRSASIGALAVAPSDPNVVWAGTGQINQRWDIAAGGHCAAFRYWSYQ